MTVVATLKPELLHDFKGKCLKFEQGLTQARDFYMWLTSKLGRQLTDYLLNPPVALLESKQRNSTSESKTIDTCQQADLDKAAGGIHFCRYFSKEAGRSSLMREHRSSLIFRQLRRVRKNSRHTRALVFDGDRLGPEGATAVAYAMESNRRVHTIRLKWNDIGVDGCSALAHMLSSTACLKLLDLTGNGIGPAGMKLLARGLAVNSSLKHLILNCNPIAHDSPMRTEFEPGKRSCFHYGTSLVSTNIKRLSLSVPLRCSLHRECPTLQQHPYPLGPGWNGTRATADETNVGSGSGPEQPEIFNAVSYA